MDLSHCGSYSTNQFPKGKGKEDNNQEQKNIPSAQKLEERKDASHPEEGTRGYVDVEEYEQWSEYAYITDWHHCKDTEQSPKSSRADKQTKVKSPLGPHHNHHHHPTKPKFNPHDELELTKTQAMLRKPEALNNLGVMYAKGEAVAEEKDLQNAKKCLEEAVRAGLPLAFYNLGGVWEEEGDMAKAFDLYRRGAALGDTRSMVALGVCYLDGVGGGEVAERNPEEAATWFERAAEKLFLPGQFELGLCYLKGDGVKRDPKKALSLLEECALRGYTDAAKLLSKMYLEGEEEYGVARDPSRGLQFLRLAARKDPDAMVRLGAKYLEGSDGLLTDEAKAFQFFFAAARKGDPQGQAWTGCCYIHGNGVAKDVAEGNRYLTLAAAAGDSLALYELGALSWLGEESTPADPQRAFELFSRAAEKGHPHAKFALGRIHETGDAVEANLARAISLYEEAAREGSSDAEAFLGMMYEEGRGMATPDPEKAVALYTSAAKKGNPIAQAALGMAYAEGRGVPVNRRKAFELFETAANQGHGEALSHLAYMYEMGEVAVGSVEPDHPKAAQYYTMAVEQGIPSAYIGLAGLYLRGLGVEMDVYKAIELYQAAADKGLAEGHFYLGELYAELALGDWEEIESISSSSDTTPNSNTTVTTVTTSTTSPNNLKAMRENYNAKALHHFSLGAEGGNAEAQFELGIIYAEGGLGLDSAEAEARHYLQLAAAQGHSGAREYLESLGQQQQNSTQ